MFNAPAAMWNRIAETETLRTDWANLMFVLPQEELDKAIEHELKRIEAQTGSAKVALAYLITAPLVWEMKALARFKAKVGPQGSLPDVETVDEALIVADGDYRLNPIEREMLRALLLVEPDAEA